ncbi:MAG: glutamate-1-semialdehyde 2,1-aminomutase [Oscillospiraceae bacterium]|nr:glutamate-1-semialdehyde 2,1-aminomutase [Oscillospiraceae bacterium]
MSVNTGTAKSDSLFLRAQRFLPGGVNSPVRAFKAVGGQPRFVASADGAYITDVDGNRYLDYVGSWGPMILGHNHESIREAVIKAAQNGLSFGAANALEVDMAELMTSMVPNLEMVRMTSSGTEAVMSALRVSRGFTGREKVIKFAGCYNGHADSMLVKAGSGALTGGAPDSAGVTSGAAKDTLIATYNDLESVETLFEQNKNEIAAVIVEPVAANMGVILPEPGFLEGLRKLCDAYGALLIFDEVITGFRLAPGGAQARFGIKADLVAFGKIIGGGLPVGAYGGRRDIMQTVAPLGKVYQAGTLSGNPVAMAAGIATLTQLRDNPGIYTHIETLGKRLADGLSKIGNTVNQIGSLVCMFMTKSPVTSYETAIKSDTEAYAAYFRHMLENGIYLAPAQFEAMFISAAHTESEIDKTIELGGQL